MLVEVVIVFFCLIPLVVASEGNTTIQQLPFRLLGFNPCWLWSQISLVVCVYCHKVPPVRPSSNG